MTLQFFDICRLLVLTSSFPASPSSSYLKKHWNKAYDRIVVCEKVAREAQKQGVNTVLAISVAARETRFTSTASKKGAQGPMGVIPKYHCPKGSAKGCDFIKAGVSALKKFMMKNGNDLCPAVAQYNRGNTGICKEGRSEFEYAQDVLDYYQRACAEAPSLCAEC
jgi:soluble lytic murein transglycosylase-like protein